MRLAACALSAVLLSGCSWLGAGGGHNDAYGYNNYGYGGQGQMAYHQGQSHYDSGCAPMQAAQPAMIASPVVASPGCAPGQGYAVGGSGQYAGAGQYGGSGYQAGSAYGGSGYQAGGMYGTSGQYGGAALGSGGAYASGGAYGAGMGATTLSTQAPYGAAVGGQMGSGYVQTVQGAPIYMAGPAGYAGGNMGLRGPMGGAGCCGGGASMPFGIELGIGRGFGIGGDISPDEVSKPFLGGPGSVSDIPAVSYNDAFKQGVHYNGAVTYDLNRTTTLLGQVGYEKSKGQRLKIGTVDDGAGTTEDLFGEFSDLDQLTVEGGLRHYMGGHGHHSKMRPYVGATAGAVKTKDVTLTQSSATLVDPTLFTQTYIDGGWSPTASGIVGAEWAVGNRSAIGIETGVRWSDNLKTNLKSTDRWSVPLKLRGRVSF